MVKVGPVASVGFEVGRTFLRLQMRFPSLMVGPYLLVSSAGVHRISLTFASLSASDFVHLACCVE